MIEINLIKERALTKQIRNKVVKILTIAVIGITLLLIGFILYYISLVVKIDQYKNDIDKVEAEISQISGRYDIDKWQSDWEHLYKQLKTIENIFLDRKVYVSGLARIADVLPDEMIIRNIAGGGENSDISIDVLT